MITKATIDAADLQPWDPGRDRLQNSLVVTFGSDKLDGVLLEEELAGGSHVLGPEADGLLLGHLLLQVLLHAPHLSLSHPGLLWQTTGLLFQFFKDTSRSMPFKRNQTNHDVTANSTLAVVTFKQLLLLLLDSSTSTTKRKNK